MIYRRFGYLQARLLLEKQDELRLLEEELDVYDKKHEIYLTSRMLPDHEVGPRKEMLSRIEQAFNAYGKTHWRAVAAVSTLTQSQLPL